MRTVSPGRDCTLAGSSIGEPYWMMERNLVGRALLRFGRSYEQAVETFRPYSEIRDPNPETRGAMRQLIGRAKEKKETLFLFVNNRLEGNSPLTILSVVDGE
jgi:hypothetical protein